jgi:ABC-type oligopeptide transport system ATPase subunit
MSITPPAGAPLLEVCDLVKEFKVRDSGRAAVVHAVSGVSFGLAAGEGLFVDDRPEKK